MSDSENRGFIKEFGLKKYIEWTVPNYFSISQTMNNIQSPSFSFCNDMWHLVIYPHGQSLDSTGWVSIYLKKQYPSYLKQCVNFKIGIRGLQKAKYATRKGIIKCGGALYWGTAKLCREVDLIGDKSLVSGFGDSISFFCTLFVSDCSTELFTKTRSISEEFKASSIKFNPATGVDTIMQGGVITSISTKLQSITVMKEYENTSFEELRLDDLPGDLVLPPVKESSNFFATRSVNRKITRAARRTQVATTSGFRFPFPSQNSAPTTAQTISSTQAATISGFRFPFPSQNSAPTTAQTIDENKTAHEVENDLQMRDCEEVETIFGGISKLSEDLKELYVNGEDSDVIFEVEDKQFKAHKTILNARSPVFAKMFRHDMVENINGVVEITDCNPDAFQDFLLYLYSGKTENFSSDIVLDLYVMADKYDVPLLKAWCVKYMTHNLCIDNFCEIMKLALRFSESAVIENATKFFVENIKNIILTVEWLNFQKENPVVANELHIKAINKLLPS